MSKTSLYVVTVMPVDTADTTYDEPIRLVFDGSRTHAGDLGWLLGILRASPAVESMETQTLVGAAADAVYVLGDHSSEHRTKTGRILSDADIQAFADEAERGFDVDR